MVCLLISCLFAEIATWCRRTLLRFVAFFAALDAAFRSIDLRGTFIRNVAIFSKFEALGGSHDFSNLYVQPPPSPASSASRGASWLRAMAASVIRLLLQQRYDRSQGPSSLLSRLCHLSSFHLNELPLMLFSYSSVNGCIFAEYRADLLANLYGFALIILI